MNLIPEDYKRYLQQLHMLSIWAMSMFVFIVVTALVSFGLSYKADKYQQEIVILEKQKSISSQQRSLLQGLEKNRMALIDKYSILQKLRGGALAADMFVTVDRALIGKNVWFKDWRFERAGSKTSEQSEGVNTGYFIVITEAERKDNKSKNAWKIQTHMEVNGAAKDHEALSSFVRRLLQQPQIGDIRILNTHQTVQSETTVVDFKLIITVNSQVTNS